MKVLGREARDKHKFDIALKYCKSTLTDFRTEERRKVLRRFHYHRNMTLSVML